MNIGLKKRGSFGVKRFGFEAKLERIEKSKSAVDPKRDTLTVFFKGLEGIGFFSMTPNEFDMLREYIHPKKETKSRKVVRKPKKKARKVEKKKTKKHSKKKK